MKAKLYLDLDKQTKDLIKTVASSRGLSMTKYLISLVVRDIQTNQPILPMSITGDYISQQDNPPTRSSRGTDIVYVQLDPFIDKARQALIDLKSWKDVAIALALVTGRRMFSEILMDTTEFSLIDGQDMTVMFWGQAKTRGRGESEAYQIPTLVEAELVVKGYQYLASLGKLGDTSEANDLDGVKYKTKNRHSRYINQHVKSDWTVIPGAKPRTLRELYAIKASQNYQSEGGQQELNVYICNILRLGDRSVADAYLSYYHLID